MASPSSMLVPGDFNLQQESIKRRRELLDAMVQRTKPSEGQMVSGHYVAPSALDGIANLAATYGQISGNKNLDQEQADSKQAYQEGLGGAVQDYLKTREGYMETPQGPMPDGSAMPEVKVKGDPRKALVDAITSQYAPMQQLGMAELTSSGKQTMTPKDIFALAGEGKYDPKSVQAAAQAMDVSLLKPMGKTHSVNGQLVTVGGETPAEVLGDYRDKFGDVGQVGYDSQGRPIMGQSNQATKEVKFAPGGGTTVNVDTGLKGAGAFAVKSNESAVKKLEDSNALATKAVGSYEAFNNAQKLIGDLPGGLAAQPINTAKRFLAMFGADDPTITSAEQVNQALKTAILDNAHIFGTGNGFTDKDREELARIVGADPSLSPQTLKYMVNKGIAASINTIRTHEALMEKASRIQGADPAVLSTFAVPMPSVDLNGDDFDYSPRTGLLSAKGGGVRKQEAAMKTPPAAPSLKPLDVAEQQELAALRAKMAKKGGK